jgi:hypothetical protein
VALSGSGTFVLAAVALIESRAKLRIPLAAVIE